MSTGSLQQLSAIGVQNAYLDLGAQTSLFKRTYKRPTSYAVECIDVPVVAPRWGDQMHITIPRAADLITEMYLIANIDLLRPADETVNDCMWTNVLGHAMIEEAHFQIGSTNIDTITGDFLEIIHEVGSNVNKDIDELVLRANQEYTPAAAAAQLEFWSKNGNTNDVDGQRMTQLWTQLEFWFGRGVRSQSLPIISLQYHDCKVILRLRRKEDLIVWTNPDGPKALSTEAGMAGDIRQMRIGIHYVYLGVTERTLFAQHPSEYLIRNIQQSVGHVKNAGAGRMSAQLMFNHPVIALYFFVRRSDYVKNNIYFNWEMTPGLADDPITSMRLLFNGAERERAKGPLYYRKVQTTLYFERTPRRNLYCYSFAAAPLSWAPTGSCNFSRLDNVSMELTFSQLDNNNLLPAGVDDQGAPLPANVRQPFSDAELNVISTNFNVLRISGGLAALKFAT